MEPETVDWFGNPIHADGAPVGDPVPCPHCDASFRRAPEFTAHLAADHAVIPPGRRGGRTRTGRGGVFVEWVHSLQYLSPLFVLPINAMATMLFWQALLGRAGALSLKWVPYDIGVLVLRTSLLPSVVLIACRVAGGPIRAGATADTRHR